MWDVALARDSLVLRLTPAQCVHPAFVAASAASWKLSLALECLQQAFGMYSDVWARAHGSVRSLRL